MLLALACSPLYVTHAIRVLFPLLPFYRESGPDDGLARCGETELVRDTVTRFAEMVSSSGFAENFNAVTGEGLRDRSYTWTASAFLVMCHEFL